MTPKQSAQIVALLLAAFPATGAQTKNLTATSQLYERMLADLDVDAATAAVERLIATCKFLPTVAEIREAAMTVACGEKRPGGEAWGDVLQAVRRFGAYRTPVFADPLVERTVKALGWQELCLSENQAADRARFVQLYDQLAASDRRDQLAAGLPSGERYKQLQRSGEARPVSEAIGRLLSDGKSVH